MANSNGSLAMWLMNGSTIMSSATPTYQGSAVSPDSTWNIVEIGDFNGSAAIPTSFGNKALPARWSNGR